MKVITKSLNGDEPKKFKDRSKMRESSQPDINYINECYKKGEDLRHRNASHYNLERKATISLIYMQQQTISGNHVKDYERKGNHLKYVISHVDVKCIMIIYGVFLHNPSRSSITNVSY